MVRLKTQKSRAKYKVIAAEVLSHEEIIPSKKLKVDSPIKPSSSSKKQTVKKSPVKDIVMSDEASE